MGGMADSKLFKTIADIGKVAGTGAAVMGAPVALPAVLAGEALAKKNPIKSPVKPIKQSREMLAQDLAALRNDPMSLGLSRAEQQQMRADATQAATAQNQAQATQLAQQALAGQGFQQGAFNQAQAQLGQSAADAGVKAGAQINDLNNRIIEQKRGDIMQRLDAERERAKENTRFWLNMGIKGVSSIMAAATGAPSPMQGLSLSGGESSSGGGQDVNVNVADGSPTDVEDALEEAERAAAMTGYR